MKRRKGLVGKLHADKHPFDRLMAYRYGDGLADAHEVVQFVGFARASAGGPLWQKHVAQVLDDKLREALAAGDGRFFRELGTIIDKQKEPAPGLLDAWICSALFSIVSDKKGTRTVQLHADKTPKELFALYTQSPMARQYKPSLTVFRFKLREHGVTHKRGRAGRPRKVHKKRKY